MIVQDGADKPKGEIGQRLDNPAGIVTLEELAARWFRATASFTLPGLAVMASDPGLIGRIRGAFGERLAASASKEALAGMPCPWSPPCAFEALWRKQGRMDKGFDHASPWVIQLDPHGGDLTVRLNLFGFATDWMPAALEAMSAALVHDVDWKGRTDYFVPKPVLLHRNVEIADGVSLMEPVERVEIDLITPLSLTGTDPREKPRSLVMGLIKRLDALARWHDRTLDPALDRDVVARWMETLALDWQDCESVHWRRGSNRQDRWIEMRGLVGVLSMGNAQAPLPPDFLLALQLGQTCHWGADVAFGCGRFDLTFQDE